ncbi:MAG: Thivi_2564 family membrane protein, partial [Candidatus Acidiferrales bacterium]
EFPYYCAEFICRGKSFDTRDFSPAIEGGKSSMPLVQILLVLIVVGVLLWLVNSFIPMQGTIKSILNAVVVIIVVLWLLNVFGLLHSLNHIRIGT